MCPTEFSSLTVTVSCRLSIRERHGIRYRGYRSNNRGDGDKSREQSGNTAVMGFRFSDNTTGNKGHKRDGRTEAHSNKTA